MCLLRLTLIAALLGGTALPAAASEPYVDDSKTSRALEAGGVEKRARRLAVTVYEVRTGVPEIDARAATEVFTTALVKSRQFRVVERSNLGGGVSAEHQLNADGATTGDVATKKLRGAQFIFEAIISESNPNKSQSEGGFSIGGMTIGGSKDSGEIGMDVRVINAGNGEVLDAINVRKKLSAGGASLSGVGNLAGTVLSRMNGSAGSVGSAIDTYQPDAALSISGSEGMDKAVRALIELAVTELASNRDEWLEE
jgi:curli biogenesis system outer membrane secretion channel CsgG